jgi:hypothetical protein
MLARMMLFRTFSENFTALSSALSFGGCCAAASLPLSTDGDATGSEEGDETAAAEEVAVLGKGEVEGEGCGKTGGFANCGKIRER